MDETFSTFDRILSIVGIRFFAKKNWDSKPWLLFQIFNFTISVFSFVFTSTYVATNFSNLLFFIQGACIWTTGVIMTLSLGVCLFFRNAFRTFLTEMAFKDSTIDMPLLETVLKMDKGSKLMELKTLVEDSQEKLLKYSRLTIKIYQGVTWLCWILYLCSPIYIMIEQNDSSLRLLGNFSIISYISFCVYQLIKIPLVSAFDIWFPWSLEDFKVYIASFIFHAYCAFLSSVIHPGLQCTILLLIGQVIRQLRILGFILLYLDELSTEITVNDPGKWQQCCTAILTQCVKHYIALKKFSNKLNVICRPFYLTMILVSIMLVCMCSVKITISNKLSPDTMKYYVHGFCYILVVLMFCLLGQQVENESTLLENAVTEKWYIFDRSHKKNVIIFHMALSQHMPIYIFGTVTLSLPTFTWFIKTGMSFFTLVMSFFEETE